VGGARIRAGVSAVAVERFIVDMELKSFDDR